MLKARFDLHAMIADAGQLAWVVPAEQLFTWLSRRLTAPRGFAVLLCGTGDPLLVRENETATPDAGNIREVLFARTAPLVMESGAPDLRSRDRHAVRGTLRCAVRILPEPAELAALRKQLIGSSGMLRLADLQAHLMPAMRQTLVHLAHAETAEELLSTVDQNRLRAAVLDRLGPLCLACGLALEPEVSVAFDSPEWQEHRRHARQIEQRASSAAARARIQEALATAQRERLGGIASILERMAAAVANESNLSMLDVLAAYTESERGQMYAALWHLCPPERTTSRLLAVSSTELISFDVASINDRPRRTALPDTLGSLRSVSIDEQARGAGLALVGAARGVHVVEIVSGNVRASLAAPPDNAAPRGGVNRAVMHGDSIYATHSELGVLAWDEALAGATVCRRPVEHLAAAASAVRGASVHGEQLWFTTDATLHAVSLDGSGEHQAYPFGSATLTAVTFSDQELFVGDVNGRIIRCDIGDPDSAEVLRGPTGGAVESLRVLDAGGVPRLLIADRGSALLEMVIGDTFVRRYESRGPVIRRAVVAEDLFCAMNDQRDRLLIWRPDQPESPEASLLIPHLAGGTVHDIALA